MGSAKSPVPGWQRPVLRVIVVSEPACRAGLHRLNRASAISIGVSSLGGTYRSTTCAGTKNSRSAPSSGSSGVDVNMLIGED